MRFVQFLLRITRLFLYTKLTLKMHPQRNIIIYHSSPLNTDTFFVNLKTQL